MLLAAGLPTPTTISVHGYITADGQKMSKSLGNVIDPFDLVAKYGLEPVRYYLLKEIPTHADGDFNYAKFQEVYTADLANGLGNLCSRVAKLAEKTGGSWVVATPTEFDPEVAAHLNNWNLDLALKWLVTKIGATDQFLSDTKP
jgi:methionyl-tRNA synthetase